jgi:hypothetical protein
MFQTIVIQIEWIYFLFNMEIRAEVLCITTVHVCIIIIASTLQLQYQGKGEYLGIWDNRQSSINKSSNLPDSYWPEQNCTMRLIILKRKCSIWNREICPFKNYMRHCLHGNIVLCATRFILHVLLSPYES